MKNRMNEPDLSPLPSLGWFCKSNGSADGRQDHCYLKSHGYGGLNILQIFQFYRPVLVVIMQQLYTGCGSVTFRK